MNRMWVRQTLAFLLVAWVSVGAMALVVQRTTETSFRQYIMTRGSMNFNAALIDSLQSYYMQHGTWIGANSLLGRNGNGMMGWRGGLISVADAAGLVVVSTDQAQIGQTLNASDLSAASPLTVDGQVVGYLYQPSSGAPFGMPFGAQIGAQVGAQVLDAAEQDFLNHATQTLTLAAAVISLLAVALGLGLSHILTRPLQHLTESIRDLPSRALGQQVQVRGTREIHALTDAFNRTSQQLADAEALRRRMAADIAHELRTPVTVLRGHLEAMRDGVFPLDQQHLAVVYDQTLHLGRLVEDVRLLTLAEANHLPLTLTQESPNAIVHDLAEGFRPLALDAEVQLQVEEQPAPSINVDKLRLQQVIGNLLTNALRHTPPDGTITLAVTCAADHVRFSVSNTGQTLTPEDAKHVFDPFWRASDARERDTGGSGLGLAIARGLVELHHGKLWVEVAADRTCFLIELPCVSLPA